MLDIIQTTGMWLKYGKKRGKNVANSLKKPSNLVPCPSKGFITDTLVLLSSGYVIR